MYRYLNYILAIPLLAAIALSGRDFQTVDATSYSGIKSVRHVDRLEKPTLIERSTILRIDFIETARIFSHPLNGHESARMTANALEASMLRLAAD